MPAAAGNSTLSTVNALAARTGLSEPTVRRALTLGAVEAASRGKYPTAEAEAAIRQHVDPAKVAGHALVGRGNVEAHQLANGANFGPISAVRREVEELKAEKLRDERAIRRGQWVDRADVLSCHQDVTRRAAFHFLDLGRRIAPRLVGMMDKHAIRELIEGEARKSLEVLSDPSGILKDILG